MARGFYTTYGSGSTDAVACGITGSIPTQHSFFCWIWLHGAGSSATASRLIDIGTSGASGNLLYNSSSNILQLAESWSGTQGIWTWPSPTLDTWVPLFFSYDSSSTSNKPIVYQGGTSQTVTTATAPTGTFSAAAWNPFTVGNRSDGIRPWNGKVAELAIWNAVLNSSEAVALSRGVPPLIPQRASLKLYMPLFGTQSSEPDWGPSHFAQTLTGTAKQNHAPASMWMPPSPMFVGRAAFSGSLALTQGASSVAIAQAEKFRASSAATQGNASTAISSREKFLAHLSPAANANTAAINAMIEALEFPGHVSVGDAATSGALALADNALYSVQIMESLS